MSKKQKQRSVPYDDGLLKRLQDPEYIGTYLSACINGRSDEDFEVFWGALQKVIKAHGVSETVAKTGLSRDAFYKAFKSHRNPTVKSLRKILHALDLEIAIVPREQVI